MTSLGKRLIQAAEEARAIARGEADPSTYRVDVPADVDVKAIRQQLKLTQAEFSARYGFPLGTLRDWAGQGKTGHIRPRLFAGYLKRPQGRGARFAGGIITGPVTRSHKDIADASRRPHSLPEAYVT